MENRKNRIEYHTNTFRWTFSIFLNTEGPRF
jgi:hypothetical protein